MPANTDTPFGALLGDITGESQQAAPDAAITALLLNQPLLAGLAPQTPVQAGQPVPAETPQTEQTVLPQTGTAAASPAETAQAPLPVAANPAPADEDNAPAANTKTPPVTAPAQPMPLAANSPDNASAAPPADENPAPVYKEGTQQDSSAPAAVSVQDNTAAAEAQPEPAATATPQPQMPAPQTAASAAPHPALPQTEPVAQTADPSDAAASAGAQPAQTAASQPKTQTAAAAGQTAAPAKNDAPGDAQTDAQAAIAAAIPQPVPQAKAPSDAPRASAKTDSTQKEDEQPVRKTAAATPQTLLATFLLAQMQPQPANDAATAAPQQLSGVGSAANTDGSKPESKQTDASASNPDQNAAPQTAAPDGKANDASPLPQTDAPQSGAPPAPPVPATQTAAQAFAQASVQGAVPPPHHTQQAADPAAVAAAAPNTATGLAISSKHDDADTGLDKLGLVIAAKSMDGIRHFDIRLDPPELGRVQVNLAMDDAGRARADLVVDKPQTLELLQRDAGNLNRALTDAGLDLSNNGLNFSLREQYRQNDGGADQGRSRELSVKAVVQTDASQTHAAFGSYAPNSVRLDIRV